MGEPITVGGVYRHFSRDGLFKVLHLAKDEVLGDLVVVYVALTDGEIWVRSLDDFTGRVQVEDQLVDRFSLVRESKDPRQMPLFGHREDEPTLDELPAAGTEMICSICLNTNGSDLFCICPRCGDLICPQCLSESVDQEGKRVCAGCEGEMREEDAIRGQ